ncbi:uncharacterized protein LOC131598820 [Vicia villosa]|uniref:uncharacterized protein LOC131598820 n=1 Tax=Vicia villosa TaxID=3911 RepID=UPI00273AB78E|nr:uncharacterized protein LOC131598820 [Vicia villosa]
MFNKFPLQCLLFFLIFSCLLLTSSSRRILSKDERSSSTQTKLDKESAIGLSKVEDLFEAREELMVKERMNLEMDDYPGTGANNHHDPNTPGRV